MFSTWLLKKPREAEILSPSEYGNFNKTQSLEVCCVLLNIISNPLVYELSEVDSIYLFMTKTKVPTHKVVLI